MAKMLLVVDERNIRRSLMYLLSDDGYDVIEAEDGAAGLKMACEECPNLILLDVTMPDMDGFQVLEKLKEDDKTASIPVILLTGMTVSDGEQDGMKRGADHYITKPWSPKTVALTVRVALSD